MKEVQSETFNAKATAPKRLTLCSTGYDLFSAEKITIGLRRTAIVLTDVGMKLDFLTQSIV